MHTKYLFKNWRKFLYEEYDDHDNIFHGNYGMFAIALAEEAKKRGIKNAGMMWAHNADTMEELIYGDYKIYHIAFVIGDKIYDGRGEIKQSEMTSFMGTIQFHGICQ